jgi:myosin heavy subunit
VKLTEEESAQLQDLNRIAHCLETHVINMKRDLETKFYGPDEVLEAEKAARKEEVAALQHTLEMETQARRNVEAMLLKVKKAAELREQEMNSEIETLQLNFQVLLAAKAEADAKNVQLSDQKKLLVKEIKRLRTQLVETETNLDRVEGVNVKLTESVTSLQALLQAKDNTVQALERAAELGEARYKQREAAAVSAAVVAALDAVTRSGLPAQRSSEPDVPVRVLDSDLVASAEKIAVGSADSADTLATASSSASTDHDAQIPTATDGAASVLQSTAAEAEGDADGARVATLSAEQVQSILVESQAIMSNLRPLPPHPSRSQNGRSPSDAEQRGGTLSTHSSGSNLAGVRERHNSTDSGK